MSAAFETLNALGLVTEADRERFFRRLREITSTAYAPFRGVELRRVVRAEPARETPGLHLLAAELYGDGVLLRWLFVSPPANPDSAAGGEHKPPAGLLALGRRRHRLHAAGRRLDPGTPPARRHRLRPRRARGRDEARDRRRPTPLRAAAARARLGRLRRAAEWWAPARPEPPGAGAGTAGAGAGAASTGAGAGAGATGAGAGAGAASTGAGATGARLGATARPSGGGGVRVPARRPPVPARRRRRPRRPVTARQVLEHVERTLVVLVASRAPLALRLVRLVAARDRRRAVGAHPPRARASSSSPRRRPLRRRGHLEDHRGRLRRHLDPHHRLRRRGDGRGGCHRRGRGGLGAGRLRSHLRRGVLRLARRPADASRDAFALAAAGAAGPVACRSGRRREGLA